jgi:hypothetical protein
MIVIGSKSLMHKLEHTREVIERFNSSDYDVIMSIEEFEEWTSKYGESIHSLYPTNENKYKAIVIKDGIKKQYEIELGLEDTSSLLLLNNRIRVCDDIIDGFFGEKMLSLSLPYQMLTKRSHLIYPVHFEKNIEDYHLIKSLISDDVKLDALMCKYYDLRYAEAKNRFKQRTPKLDITNEDFFSSKLPVEQYFVHDDIHEVMKHNDKPVYEMMKRDFNLAWCEKDMFFDLPYEYQIQCVQEEAYVISLERYIIPQYKDDWYDYFNCYKKSLKRICTTLCSGWFRDFAIENYPEIIKQYNPLFVDKFINAFESGKVRTIDGKEVPWRRFNG